MSEKRKYRLVTRSDFDGLVCGVLLRELDILDEVLFVHPKDMQDRKIEITDNDITTNLPYVEGCHLAFDHHASEILRLGEERPANHVINPEAPSASRVVYEYFGGKEIFPTVSEEMMAAVDKGDSAQFTRRDVMHPTGWVLLNFLMDARTGLGRFRRFRVSNYQLMMELIEHCRHHTVDEILNLMDVKERVDLYQTHEEVSRDQIQRCSTIHGDLVVLDLRDEEKIFTCNRFLIYALFPECNISMHVIWGKARQNTVFAMGKSIFNKTSKVNIGSLALQYGGGGHANAGTCQADNDQAEQVLRELIEQIRAHDTAGEPALQANS